MVELLIPIAFFNEFIYLLIDCCFHSMLSLGRWLRNISGPSSQHCARSNFKLRSLSYFTDGKKVPSGPGGERTQSHYVNKIFGKNPHSKQMHYKQFAAS